MIISFISEAGREQAKETRSRMQVLGPRSPLISIWVKAESAVLLGGRNTGHDDSSNYMGGGTRGMHDLRGALQISNVSCLECVCVLMPLPEARGACLPLARPLKRRSAGGSDNESTCSSQSTDCTNSNNNNINNNPSEKVGSSNEFLTCIRAVFGSTLEYPEWGLSSLYSALQANAGIVPSNKPLSLPYTSFPNDN